MRFIFIFRNILPISCIAEECFNQYNRKAKRSLSFIMRKFLISNSSGVTSAENTKRKSTDADSKNKDEPVSAGDQAAKKSKLSLFSSNPADLREPEQVRTNKIDTDWNAIDFSCSKTSNNGGKANFKIASWNIAGIRACIKKNGFEYLRREDADIVCLQEVKCPTNKLPPEVNIAKYYKYWDLGIKPGYAGVGLYSKEKPLNVKYGVGNQELDSEGRLITAEYDKFFLVTTYVPNSGDGLKTLPKRKLWDVQLRKLLKSLDEKKPVILAGDLNVCHQEIDLHNPKSKTRTPGFTNEERDAMTALLNEGFVDSFRALYPDKTEAYSWWSYIGNARSKNIGWRLDYFVVSERFMDNVCDSVIRSEVYGSDHCPVVLHLSI